METEEEKRDREMREEARLQAGTESMGDNAIGGMTGNGGTSEVVESTIKIEGIPDDNGTEAAREIPTEEKMTGNIGSPTEIQINDDSCLTPFKLFWF